MGSAVRNNKHGPAQSSNMQITLKFLSRITCIVVMTIASIPVIVGQSPYQFDVKREAALLGAGAAMHVSSLVLTNNMQPLSERQIALYALDGVDGIDRRATTLFSDKARATSDITRNVGLVLPVTLLIPRATRSESGKIGLLLLETYGVVAGLTYLSKSAFHRPRPFVYNPNVHISEKRKLNAQYSFFSGHTSLASGMSFFAAKVFSDYHPDSPLQPYVWATAATIPALTGYLRVRAGKHFPSDVITGYAVGALAGILIPQMHKQNRNTQLNWGLHSSSEGIVFQLQF